MKLFSYLNYENRTLMNDLQNKINNRLQDALSICLKDFITLNRLKSFLQSVNNRQRVNYQLRNERRIVTAKVVTAPEKRVTLLLAALTSVTGYVKPIIFLISESARSFIICYTCKASGHLFKNYSQQNKTDISTSRAFISRLHEIIISEDKENEKMSFENNEIKN